MSIIDGELRKEIEPAAIGRAALSILDPVVSLLTTVLGQAMVSTPEGSAPDRPISIGLPAVDYAVSHDDGMNMGNLRAADMLLVGVSRTSKHPHRCIWRTVATRLLIMPCANVDFHCIILMG